MILLLVLGYIVAYMIMLMMLITFVCAVVISFATYVVSYYALWAWAAVRHRKTPEWRYQRRKFEPPMEKIHEGAVWMGVAAMGLMVIGFFVYAFTSSWATVFTVTGVLAGITGFVVLDTASGKKRRQNQDRGPTWGEIQDRHRL